MSKELFVYSKIFSRGDEIVHKFRIQEADVLESAKLYSGPRPDLSVGQFEGEEQAVETFLEEAEAHYKDGGFDQIMLLREIITGGIDGEKIDVNVEKGFGVMGEEVEYGVAPTKEGAKLAYVNIPRGVDVDGDDENW